VIEIAQRDYRVTLARVADMGGADLVAFSPPYCDARTYGAAVSWTDADYRELGDHVFAALRPGGHALVNIDAPVREWRPGHGTERGLHPWRMLLDWAERVGFDVPDRLAFGRLGVPGAYRGRFRNDWEPLLWFRRPGGDPWLDKVAISTPARSGEYARTSGSNRRADGSLYRRRVSGFAAENGLLMPGTMWNYDMVGNGQTGCPSLEDADHPARWPYRLAIDIVRCFCPPGGLVCDPFVGAGTTALACVHAGRRFVGGDLLGNSDGRPWADVANDIIAEATMQQPMFGGRP
jgi:adenine-specific DNA-methyltransferase